MAGAVAQFVVAGLVAVIVFGAVAIVLLRELGRREAVSDARELAVVVGQGIVEPALAGVPSGSGAATTRLDRIVQERVLSDRVVRVKIWSRDGRIVYSDEPRLIGARYRLGADEREALEDGKTYAELSDLDRPENRFERGQGDLYEVYTRVRAPGGTPLLFETYQRSSSLVVSRPRGLAAVRDPRPRQRRPALARPGAARLAPRVAPPPRARWSARRCSSTPSSRLPTSAAGSQRTSTTGPSRISPVSRTR